MIGWADEALDLRIDVDGGGMARITGLTAPPSAGSSPPATASPAPAAGAAAPAASAGAALPLLDVVLAGEGKGWSGGRYCESEAGGRFRYVGHEEGGAAGPWRELRVDLEDPVTGLRAEVFFRVLIARGAL